MTESDEGETPVEASRPRKAEGESPMADDLVVPANGGPEDLARASLVERTLGYAAAARSPRTLREYRRVPTAFGTWCAERGVSPLPAEASTVAMYLTSRADEGRSVATLEQELAAITSAHVRVGLPSPRLAPHRARSAERVAAPVADAAAAQGAAPGRGAAEGGGEAARHALLLVGFAGAFRRSELVAVEARDLEWADEGLRVTIRSSKKAATIGTPSRQPR